MRRLSVIGLLAASCGSVADSTPDGSADASGADGQGAADGPVVIDAPTYTIDQSNQTPLGSAGSPSSGSPFVLACPMATVLVGMEGHATSVPCDLDMVCADPDATTVQGDVRLGGAGGSACTDAMGFADRCTVGEAVVGLHGSTTTGPVSVGSLGITCAPLRDWTTPSSSVAPRRLAPHGTLGTTPFDFTCPPSMVVWGGSGRAGTASIDQIAGSCVAVARD